MNKLKYHNYYSENAEKRVSGSSTESELPIESEIEMEPPSDQLRELAFNRRHKNWLEESWSLIDMIEKNNKGRQATVIHDVNVSPNYILCFKTMSGLRQK